MKHWTSKDFRYEPVFPEQDREALRGPNEGDPSPIDPFVERLIELGQVSKVGQISLEEDPNRAPEPDDGEPEQSVPYPSVAFGRDIKFLAPEEPAESMVVLLVQRGRYSWHFYKPKARERGAGSEDETLFDIQLASQELVQQLRKQEDSQQTRNLDPIKNIVTWLVDGTKVYLLKLAAKATVERVTGSIDGKIRPGIVPLFPVDGLLQELDNWKAKEDWIGKVPFPSEKKPRVLLLIHGAFSSTKGSFADLRDGFLQHAIKQYDLILGFDHATLGQQPGDNASALQHELDKCSWFANATFDAIAFSRGGLVLRWWIEKILPGLETNHRPKVERVVFVGCTNAGTILANPRNWKEFLNYHTNLIISGLRVSGWITGQPALGIGAEIIANLCGFARAIAERSGSIPGIHAMAPDSEFLVKLNSDIALRPKPNEVSYHAILSNYVHSKFETGAKSNTGQNFLSELGLAVCDTAIDTLFAKAPNDLVVNCDSMTNVGSLSELYFQDRIFHFGNNGYVFHTVYFAHPNTHAYLARVFNLGKLPESKQIENTPKAKSDYPREHRDRFLAVHGSLGAPHSADDWESDIVMSQIEFSVEWADVTQSKGLPSDTVFAVGHYDDVPPQRAQGALDRVVSRTKITLDKDLKDTWKTERGVVLRQFQAEQLNADLGDIEIFPWAEGSEENPEVRRRLVAFCGMGRMGEFDEAKARTLYRSLFERVARMPYYKTVATVLIGTGEGALDFDGSLRGLLEGLADAIFNYPSGLEHIRIVERDIHRAVVIHAKLKAYLGVAGKDVAESVGSERLPLTYGLKHHSIELILVEGKGGKDPLGYHQAHELLSSAIPGSSLFLKEFATTPDHLRNTEKIELGKLKAARLAIQLSQAKENLNRSEGAASAAPTRLSFTWDNERQQYRAAALTESLTVPDRAITINRRHVRTITRQILALGESRDDISSINCLLAALIPPDFDNILRASSPLIMIVDSETASIPWELFPWQPRILDSGYQTVQNREVLGLKRPISRQLKTPHGRVSRPRRSAKMRAMVIGDPSRKHPLPGAQDEARQVSELLRKNTQIEVTEFIGPSEDGIIRVLTELYQREYQLLHFAGHATFDPTDPRTSSGWIFGEMDELLSAGEIQNNAAPLLVVANACVTIRMASYDQQIDQSGLAGSLAEQFFKKGTQQYIGTAWKIPDGPAKQFPLDFYERYILGRAEIGSAVFDARKALKNRDAISNLWAAYHHFGNPEQTWSGLTGRD